MTETAPSSHLMWSRGYTDPAWIRRFTAQGRELSPSRRVWRGLAPARHLPHRAADLDALDVVTTDAGALKLADLFAAAQTDAFVVLHRGEVVYERYLHGTDAHTPHFNASAAKSYLGLVAATLAHQGILDRTAPASAHVPELAGTAFGDARVQDLLHMGTRVSYAGRPFDKALEAQRYQAVIAPRLRPFGYSGPDGIREQRTAESVTG